MYTWNPYFSCLTDYLARELHKVKCEDCKFCLKYVKVNTGLLVCKCVECNKKYEKEFEEDLAKSLRRNTDSVMETLTNLCDVAKRFLSM